MTTVVNNPQPSSGSGGNGFLIGILVLVGFVTVLIYFGLPVIRNMGPLQMSLPATQIVVPDKVDINVTETK